MFGKLETGVKMKRLGFSVVANLAVAFLGPAAFANLFVNGGFESVPSAAYGQGLMPSAWLPINLSPDTYSEDGSYGLFPWDFGNFPGVSAHGGSRWVAGGNIDQFGGGESFGQVLTSPLVAGTAYQVDGWLHQALRTDLNGPGGYDLWLDKGSFVNRLYVGHIGDTASSASGWAVFVDQFVAPTDAAEYTRFVFAPIAAGDWGAYPGLDDVSLAVVPEPLGLVPLGFGLVFLMRRRSRR